MAQDPLKRAVIILAIVGVGIATEALAPRSSASLRALDLSVGVFLGCAGVLLLDKAPRVAVPNFIAAVAWFLGTMTGGPYAAASAVGSVFLLAYRGPVLHLLLALPSGRLPGRLMRLIAGAGWLGGMLPLSLARPTTAAAAAAACLATATRIRTAGADRRRALGASALAMGSLATVWFLATYDAGNGASLLVANNLGVLAAASVALVAAAGIWARRGVSELVIDLGVARRPEQPLTARLARALGDPELQVRYATGVQGWIDEQGHAVADPGDGNTRASAPGGGEVALVHGDASSVDPHLAKAAAAAAALALDGARLEAEVRMRTAEVSASRRRLLSVGDAERRWLEQQLNDGVLARLRRVESMLITEDDTRVSLREELRATIYELTALGRGLYPPAVARADFPRALAEIAARAPIPTVVEVEGDLAGLSETHRATIWFICSEALTNVARHSKAARATINLRARDTHLELEICDDGCGGAILSRGLRGIADRVDALGGSFALSSPRGGPTRLRAQLPLASERSN